MKTITFPEDTRIMEMIQICASAGYSIRSRSGFNYDAIKNIQCEDCADTGFMTQAEIPTICHCRIEVKS